MKKNENNHTTKGGVLRKIYRIFHKGVDDASKHPLTAFLMFIFTLVLVWLGIKTLMYMAKDQPLDQLRADLVKTVINARIKIVNISEGCQGTNTYSQVLKKNNSDRVDLMGQLAAISDAGNIGKNLGLAARQQIVCFIQYNDMLNLRSNICNGPFLSEEDMKKWEKEIVHDIYHKSAKQTKCPYEVK